jgi:hypothetical protein
LFAHAADRRRRSPRAPTPALVAVATPTPRRRLAPAPAATFFDQAWGTQIDGQSLASQLFSLSLLPYLGFLYHLRKPEAKTPPLVFGGFCFLLVFVFATIPAGIYGEGLGAMVCSVCSKARTRRSNHTQGKTATLTPPPSNKNKTKKTQPKRCTARRWPTWTGFTAAPSPC